MTILALPAFSDNYIWCFQDTERVCVVDPGDSAPVFEHLRRTGLHLEAILVTHHHPDHVGGVEALRRETGCHVYGPDNPAIAGIDTVLREGDEIQVLGLTFSVYEVPGHTLDHIAYFSAGPPPRLFCGDTLFAGGCGRLFEGDPPTMRSSLEKLRQLPDETEIYCAHEYTLANLTFARAVEPNNATLAERARHVQALRDARDISLPSQLSEERLTNPFLRWDAPDVIAAAQQRDHDARSADTVFAAIRAWKDQF